MLNIAVLERNNKKRESVINSIRGLNMDISITDFHDLYDFLDSFDEDNNRFDAVFLNTTVRKEGDGIWIANKIKQNNKRILISFITDSKAYYQEAFEVFATGYFVYPVDSTKLYQCLNFHFSDTGFERRATCIIKEKGGNYRRIFCRNIRFIESENRVIRFHMEDGSTIECYAKLSGIEGELMPKNQFFRCHQSYIVNFYFVDELKSDFFILGNDRISISRKYQKLMKEAYAEYRASR